MKSDLTATIEIRGKPFHEPVKPTVPNTQDLLRLNVGFIIHETIGYSREFPIEIPKIHLEPDLDLYNLNGTVRVTRTAQGLLVQVDLNAQVPAECVRCLINFTQPLHTDFTELYAFTPSSLTESGLLVPETGKIDLAPLVREEMLVAMPMSSLCRPDCQGLCPICGENLNEHPDHHHEDEVDPRLESLKKFLEKDQDPSLEE